MLHARDIMNSKVITVPGSMTIGDLVDLLQRLNIHAAPVLDQKGKLMGMVTQEDVLYGTMGAEGEAELAERYSDLLLDAVALRLKSVQRPAFTLSGGLDSSSVLASAVRLNGAKQHAFSTVYADKTYDE